MIFIGASESTREVYKSMTHKTACWKLLPSCTSKGQEPRHEAIRGKKEGTVVEMDSGVYIQ